MPNRISYLAHKDIDKTKWDACIEGAENGAIFAMSWYLDAVCENWDALVLGEYKAVMPLPWKKKYGLKYIIQPLYTKYLGVFGNQLSEVDYGKFYKKIPRSFLYVHLVVNYHETNEAAGVIQYAEMKGIDNYNKSTRKNLRRAQKNNLTAIGATKEEFLAEFLQLERHYIKEGNKKVVRRMLGNEQIGLHSFFVKVIDEQNRLMSIIWLLAFKKRLYLLTSATHKEGREKQAKFLERDYVIQTFQNDFEILDFLGSNLPGVYEFNRGFATNEYHYYQLKSSVFDRFFRF